jgi:virginiamycin B lyase
VVTEILTATAFTAPSIAAGPDGAIWFSGNGLGGEAMVGRVDTGAKPRVTALYRLPDRAGADGIAAGADGNVWVAEHNTMSVVRVTPGGQITRYTLGPDRFPTVMAAGTDRTVWLRILSPRSQGGLARFTLPA